MIDDYDNEDYDYFKEWDIEQYKQEIERLNKELAFERQIKKEVREYIENTHYYSDVINEEYLLKEELLQILQGEDKE